jgi:hypothetical protein
MRLQVRWNKNAYAIYDVDVEDPDGRLIFRDNMWDHSWSCVRDNFDGDADAYVLDRHEEIIKEYFDTGLTLSDWYTLYSDQTITVPSRKISMEDMTRYHTISIHLGKGKEGVRRLQALRHLAAEAGYLWNNEPSIGRWLSAIADEKGGMVWKRKPTAPASDLAARVRAIAEEQITMWQALLKELDLDRH